MAPVYPLRPNQIVEWLGWIVRTLEPCNYEDGVCQHVLPCPLAEIKEYLDAEVPRQGS